MALHRRKNVSRQIGFFRDLSFCCRSFQHPSGANQKPGLPACLFPFQRQRLFLAHADSHDCQLPAVRKGQLLFQIGIEFFFRKSFSFLRPPMTTSTAPAFSAASHFSGKPPVLPASLVTRKRIWNSRSMARFNSAENGPCIQMRCRPSSPRLWHFSTTEGRDSTVHRPLPVIRNPVNASSSLLPVVKGSFLPCPPDTLLPLLHSLPRQSYRPALRRFRLLPRHALEGKSPASRKSRRYGFPQDSQACFILRETSLAYGCVASTTKAGSYSGSYGTSRIHPSGCSLPSQIHSPEAGSPRRPSPHRHGL